MRDMKVVTWPIKNVIFSAIIVTFITSMNQKSNCPASEIYDPYSTYKSFKSIRMPRCTIYAILVKIGYSGK